VHFNFLKKLKCFLYKSEEASNQDNNKMSPKLVMKCMECEKKKPVNEFSDYHILEICNVCDDMDKYHITIPIIEIENIAEYYQEETLEELIHDNVLPKYKQYLNTMDGKIIIMYFGYTCQVGYTYLVLVRTKEIGYVPVYIEGEVRIYEELKDYELQDCASRREILMWIRKAEFRKYVNDLITSDYLFEESDAWNPTEDD
jgi:hypothetical protein